jgi:hypothetical protein
VSAFHPNLPRLLSTHSCHERMVGFRAIAYTEANCSHLSSTKGSKMEDSGCVAALAVVIAVCALMILVGFLLHIGWSLADPIAVRI